jgi:hypothetical protein
MKTLRSAHRFRPLIKGFSSHISQPSSIDYDGWGVGAPVQGWAGGNQCMLNCCIMSYRLCQVSLRGTSNSSWCHLIFRSSLCLCKIIHGCSGLESGRRDEEKTDVHMGPGSGAPRDEERVSTGPEGGRGGRRFGTEPRSNSPHARSAAM